MNDQHRYINGDVADDDGVADEDVADDGVGDVDDEDVADDVADVGSLSLLSGEI